MKIKAQVAMVMNLDKCIGCHTCSVTCKTTWTNREGAEYMWFNNVETKPGIGYPKRWEDQELYKGGWQINKKGKLELKSGSKLSKIALGKIFYNPDMPEMKDYYEPWTYDYEKLTSAPDSKHTPVARAKSVVTGEYIDLEWGPNWEDQLAGAHITGPMDPNIEKIEEEIKFNFEQAFMMYLPRLCEHCLNPSCVASCPSGAIYKRDEDGIVLVDQEACRGWRYCMTGCPYKKVYFNWKTNKAEKCTFCFPRIESGLPTVCSETCTGRIRYLGVLLYDADRVLEAASTPNEKDLYKAQIDLFLDPNDPEVIAQARKDGISEEWIEGAQNSPVYKLAIEYKLAFPLHPEYRTLPMVWYVPPLSPIMNYFEGKDSIKNPDMIFPAIEEMRIPIQYLANMLTAGDTETVKGALQRMAMMRSYMRAVSSGKEFDESRLERVGLTAHQTKSMYRLLAIAKYEDRFVIPTAHKEGHMNAYRSQGSEGYVEMGDYSMGTSESPYNYAGIKQEDSSCDGCGTQPQAKSGKEIYEENFYGGIWRD
ncbi:nitrate reductase subunit beta [Sporosarcina sp. FSL K6-5500]|uniref:nitrate reductase subunit beta n=1 Tax=Sporosarcina sp. FSL K6-5500 TaxID=2921558 RepID=UPI0030F98091